MLALFERQTEMLLPRIRHADGPAAATLAHTLKGSALGIGAFRVARAAEGVEQASAAGIAGAVDALAAAHRRDQGRNRPPAAGVKPRHTRIKCGKLFRDLPRPLASAKPTR